MILFYLLEPLLLFHIILLCNYYIHFVHGITFKVMIKNKGRKDTQLVPLLEKLCAQDSSITARGSSIQIKDNKFILNLSYSQDNDNAVYRPIKNRVMGVAFAYNNPINVYISGLDTFKTVGDQYYHKLIIRKEGIQQQRRQLQIKARNYQGGHGRKQKLKSINNNKNREHNIAKEFNHKTSHEIIEMAVKNKVETIYIEKIDASDIKTIPLMMRNWSYFDLVQKIQYKAKNYGINVFEVPAKSLSSYCSICSEEIDVTVPFDRTWIDSVYIKCPHCESEIDYYENIAKNASLLGPTIIAKLKEKKQHNT